MAPENGSSNGNGTAMGTPEYMAAQPKLSKQHSRRSLASFIRHGQPNLVKATFDKLKKMTWQQKLSMIFVAILWRSGKLLKLIGFIVEWTLNLLHLNNGLLRLLWNLLTFKWGAYFVSFLIHFVFLSKSLMNGNLFINKVEDTPFITITMQWRSLVSLGDHSIS